MDKRIKKTRNRIFEVFLQLLEEKAVNDITAQEIADRAEISRSTFYQHYADVYDLLDQAEHEIFTQISHMLDGYSYEAVKSDPLHLFTELFFYFHKNSRICLVLLNKNGSITTGQRISRLIEEKFRHEWEALIDCDSEFTAHYLSQYIISGFVGILQAWIAGGMQEPEEDMAFVARLFISSSLANHFDTMEVKTQMSNFKEKIRTDARGFAGGVLQDTSGLLNEKSAEIQKKVEAGLNRAGGRLTQAGSRLQAGEPRSARDGAHKRQKLLKKKAELEQKFREKEEKLVRENKQSKLSHERAKYQEETADLDRQLKDLEA